MNYLQNRIPVLTPPLDKPAVQHEEPQVGGSFTRNIDTGGLAKTEPSPVEQTEQE